MKGVKIMISRIALEFEPIKDDSILLPKNFVYILQSFVYELGREGDLHGKIYNTNNKFYHLFTYSSIIGKHSFVNGTHLFKGPIKIYFSSPVEDFCMTVAEQVLKKSDYKIGNQAIKVKSIMPVKEPDFEETMYFTALSPITVHKTIEEGGSRKTVYLNPDDPQFKEFLIKNITSKYIAFTETNEDLKISIEPFKVENKDFKIMLYEKDKEKPFVIKGWTGIYKIEGKLDLIKFAYRSGIGARNSQGFGFIEKV